MIPVVPRRDFREPVSRTRASRERATQRPGASITRVLIK